MRLNAVRQRKDKENIGSAAMDFGGCLDGESDKLAPAPPRKDCQAKKRKNMRKLSAGLNAVVPVRTMGGNAVL